MKRTIHITEKQLNKMGLPKKVRQNLIPYGDGEEKAGSYQLSSSEGDLGYAHVVGGDAGAICESKSPIEVYYRGYYKKYGPWRDHLFWLTDNPSYAKVYGDTVAEVLLDTRRLKDRDFEWYDDFDYYDGPSEEKAAELLRDGVNYYTFSTHELDSEILCLWDKNAIVGFRELSQKEYDEIPSYDDIDESLFRGSNLITEGLDPNFDLMPYINSYNDFLVREGLPVKPFPELHLDNTDQRDIMIRTGFYRPDEKSITLFVKDRHPKDILRSYAHEMTHHIQNMEDPERDWGSGKDLKEDDVLSKIEADAYERGNMLFRKWTEELAKHPDNRLNESVNEATEADVDLSSFKVRDTLNPKLWKNGKIDSRVRLKLMDISDEFFDFLGISWVKRLDTIIVGSIANYNWSKFSDIDLHLVVDFSEIDSRKKFVEDFLNTKKREWNSEHADIKIYGFPVELYVQDKDAEVASSGVYSIEDNKWIKEPKKGHFSKKDLDTFMIKKKASDIMAKIEDIEDSSKAVENDSKESRSLYKKSDELINNITKSRRETLSTEKDEMSPDNIVFKLLRRNGYLEKLFKLRTKSFDKTMSL